MFFVSARPAVILGGIGVRKIPFIPVYLRLISTFRMVRIMVSC